MTVRRLVEQATAQIGADTGVDGIVSSVSGVWSSADATTTFNLRYNHIGSLMSGYRHDVRRGEVAAVPTTFAAGNAPELAGNWYAVSRLPGQEEVHGAAVGLPVRLPSTVMRYFNNDGGVQWRTRMYELTPECFGCSVTTGAWTSYRPGATVAEGWNRAVFSPSGGGVTRDGDTIAVDLPMYSDGAGRAGNSGDAGTTVLQRDGVEVGREEWGGSGAFTVPDARRGRYRLAVESRRGAPYALSTSVAAAWEWTGEPALIDVRFAPRLGADNSAPAGRDLAVPVTVLTPGPGPRAVTVDVSYDDGATWTRAPYAGGLALLHHPAAAGFVSLRANVRDGAGNTAAVTVIRAYRISAG